MSVSATQLKAAFLTAVAVAETIRELGEVPSGYLYAQLMGHMDLDTYQGLIGMLVRNKLVDLQPSHLLVWIGPKE